MGLIIRFTALICILLLASNALADGDERTLIVSPDNGQYTTIEAALNDAQAGDTVEVRSGTYEAPLFIDRSVTLIGYDDPVIDGGGDGTLVVITAPDVVFQGFTVRNSGATLDHEDAGIVVQAPNVTVAENVLEDVLFGIYFANADYGVARDNIVRGLNLELPRRGDGIRVWYSTHVALIGNEVTNSRDTLIWFAEDITIENNTFIDNRYGLHFMYSSRATVVENTFTNNSLGAYLMYSDGLRFNDNILLNNRGPSGHGLALKEMDDVTATGNIFVGNRSGLFLDNSPFSIDVYNEYKENYFAFNDVGVTGLPMVQRNIFQGNIFLDNIQQSATHGRGNLQGNIWHLDGIGNYWSDYVGYDDNGDNIGEMSYRAEKLFENLTDTYPELKLFTYSPAAQAIDFAASAFPVIRPEPRLVDEAPMTQMILSDSLQATEAHITVPLLFISLALIAMSITFLVLSAKNGMRQDAVLPINKGSTM